MNRGDDDRAAGWRWDPTLYAGSAAHYALGRVPYPSTVAATLVAGLELDGSGVLLDVGCGPGSLTLLLAPHFAKAIGIDAGPDMISEAARIAQHEQIHHVRWRHLRAEQLPADLPRPRVVTFAQSFHWMDRTRVAAAVRGMLAPGGAVVHVGANTHAGVEPAAQLHHPLPPHAEIDRLVRDHLGPVRRAGQGVLPAGTPGDEDSVLAAAGFVGPQRLVVPGWSVERSTEQIVSSVLSLSSSAPHLFGDGLDPFQRQLRAVLAATSPDGWFSEQLPEITLSIWR